MSFSGEVKEELVRLLPEARHCGIAELAAILEYTKAVKCDEKGAKYIEIQEETPYVARKGFTLLKKTFNIKGKMDNFVNLFRYTEEDVVQRILQAVKYEEKSLCVNPLVIKSLCCKRAFLRGAFLSIGKRKAISRLRSIFPIRRMTVWYCVMAGQRIIVSAPGFHISRNLRI